jgi:AcrR family transcriptional regulator
MQRPDEKKRQLIATTAARLFATRPFHKVKLDDVAAAAGVGKGTLYVYFKSKEDLYLWLIFDAFAQLVAHLEARLAGGALSPGESLRVIVDELVKFAFDHPQLYELMRTAGPATKDQRWADKRKEFTGLIEQTIRQGNADGTFADPHPEITAQCVPGLVRSVMLFGPKGLDETTVASQIMRLMEQGVCGRSGMRSEKREARSEKGGRNGRNGKRNAAVASGRGGR